MTDPEAGVAIVTGAAGGIGSAIVRTLLSRGGSVVGVDLSPAPAPSTDHLSWVHGDVTSPETVDAAFEAAAAAGGARALVNSTFADARAWLEDLADQALLSVFDRQVISALRWSTRLVAECRNGLGETSIVNVSSVHARSASVGAGSYAMVKSSLEALTRAMAIEWGPCGLRCNAVAPGFVPVPRNAHRWRDSAAVREIACHLPLRRVVTPAQVAEAVVFLLGPEAAGITGVCLPVDAGMSAAMPEWA